MEAEKPRRAHDDLNVPAEVADEPREVVREAADEPRRMFGDPLLVAPVEEPDLPPGDPYLPQPAQEEADEPRKRLQ